MGNVLLLDCTLRDGGYINNWAFGREAIRGFCTKMAQTGIQMLEVGFIKGESYDPDRAVFPDIESFAQAIGQKAPGLQYVGMLDLSDPVPLDRLVPCDGTSLDGIRVIFKRGKLEDAYRYCARIKELGYFFTVNFVRTDLYSDREFIEGIERFNELGPRAMTIVDTFGLIKRKQFLRLAYLADNNMDESIALGYHAHNNLQQAFGNAEAMVNMGLARDVVIDACVFGMGRGAGNLNLELFAEHLNENYGAHYRIAPMLEIMDEYLNDIYRKKFWGYSLPLYLSATTGCHPNYAIYLAEKNSLPVQAFSELLRSMPNEDKEVFSQAKAERHYRAYMEHCLDDKAAARQACANMGTCREIRRAVVTGPTGAIGTALCALLASAGVDVLAVVRPGTKRARHLCAMEGVRVVECDLAEMDRLPQIAPGVRGDAFFHLAWAKTVGAGRGDMPAQADNIRYTIDACHAAAAMGCSVFVGAGSQAEYGRTNLPLAPTTPCHPESGYGMAKLCAGQMSRVECAALGVDHVWARILSVYGPYDGRGSLVSMLINRLSCGEPMDLTACEQVWDYLYADDAAEALYRMALHGHSGSVYPLGSGVSRPLREYVEEVRDCIDPSASLGFGKVPYGDQQVMHLEADISALTTDTGFVSRTTFSAGICRTIAYWETQSTGAAPNCG